MQFGFYTVSYGGEKRAKIASTVCFFPQITIITRESDIDAYKAAFPNNRVVGFPDDSFGWGKDLTNAIRDKFKDDVACIMDDDLQSVVLFRTMEKLTDSDFVFGKICDIAQIIYDLQLPYATTTNDLRPYGRNTIFNSVGTNGGIRFCNFSITEPKDFVYNNDEFGMFADAEMIIRLLAKYRIIFSFNHIVFHFDLQGANTTTSYAARVNDCAANMLLKYGKYFSYNPKRNMSTIKVKR